MKGDGTLMSSRKGNAVKAEIARLLAMRDILRH